MSKWAMGLIILFALGYTNLVVAQDDDTDTNTTIYVPTPAAANSTPETTDGQDPSSGKTITDVPMSPDVVTGNPPDPEDYQPLDSTDNSSQSSSDSDSSSNNGNSNNQ